MENFTMTKSLFLVCAFLACACLPLGTGCVSHQAPSSTTPSTPAKPAVSAKSSSDARLRPIDFASIDGPWSPHWLKYAQNAEPRTEETRQTGLYVSDLQAATLFLGGKYVGSDCQPDGTVRLEDGKAFYRYHCKPPTKPAVQEVPALQLPDTEAATFYTPYRNVWLVLYQGTPTFFWRAEDGGSIGQALTPTAEGYSFSNLAAQYRFADRDPKNPSVPIF